MRRRAVTVLFAACLLITEDPLMFAQTSAADSIIAELVDKWDKRDGAAFIEVGSQLSEQLVLHDTAFFRAMKLHPESFRTWAEDLPSSTFTVYDFKDVSDSVRLRAESIKLRDDMLAQANWFGRDPEFGIMAKLLIRTLKKVRIRFIQ